MKQRVWWALIPTIVAAVATATVSYLSMPTRYQAESVLVFVPQRLPDDVVDVSSGSHLSSQLRLVDQLILNRTNLTRLIDDFDLYAAERSSTTMEALVTRVRDDVTVTADMGDVDEARTGTIRVAFRSEDPRTAMRVAERISALLIDADLRDRQIRSEGTQQFLLAEIENLRRQIVQKESELESLRAKTDRALSQADLLPYDVLKETYKSLLAKVQEVRIAANMERRQIGGQLTLFEAPRVPDAPVGPSRTAVNLGGALVGLCVGLVGVGIANRQRQ